MKEMIGFMGQKMEAEEEEGAEEREGGGGGGGGGDEGGLINQLALLPIAIYLYVWFFYQLPSPLPLSQVFHSYVEVLELHLCTSCNYYH